MIRITSLAVVLSFLGLALWSERPVGADFQATKISWKKTHVDKVFRSEGVAVADVNRDGKMDILAGDVWYQAPDWKMHAIRKPGDYGDGAKGYSQSFACFADDINGDGWVDLLVIGFPGQPCHWYENPKGQDVPWKPHMIWRSACNETPQYVDLFGDGKKKLIMATQPEGQMCWFGPGKDPTQVWEMHPISVPSTKDKKVPGTDVYSHGLGVGDINGDGRLDVICTGGWWEQPAKDDGKPWRFHPANLGGACADMYTYQFEPKGLADVISSSAHNYGIWRYQHVAQVGGEPTFAKVDLFPRLFSQSHAMNVADINGDGLKDFVTGKRWWAHGPVGDADPNDPAVLYWFEAKRGDDGKIQFVPHQIDKDSGIGTQFVVADINGDGLLDIIVSNKKGTFVFEQVRNKNP
jgi:hypothetical protein